MKIVIDIDENIYHRFVSGFANEDDAYLIEQLFKNGTLLPKGHGRLIDASMLRSMYAINRATINTVVDLQKWVDGVPTIIEADK